MSGKLFELPVLPIILGILAGGLFYFWSVKSNSKLVVRFRNLCLPRPYFQESILEGSLGYSFALAAALLVSSVIVTDITEITSRTEGFLDTLLLPFVYPIFALNTFRWDMNKPKRAKKSNDTRYHGENLNWACYGVEAFMTFCCCLVFVLVFDTAYYLMAL